MAPPPPEPARHTATPVTRLSQTPAPRRTPSPHRDTSLIPFTGAYNLKRLTAGNVELADTPEGGKDRRPSNALNLNQAPAVLQHPKDDPLNACVPQRLPVAWRRP